MKRMLYEAQNFSKVDRRRKNKEAEIVGDFND